MTLTLNDTLVFHPYFPIADCFCNKVQIKKSIELIVLQLLIAFRT